MDYTQVKEQILNELPTGTDFEASDNLLKLGLDSLKIMRLVNQWRKQGIRIPYGALMENPTLENWWELIQKREKKKKKVQEDTQKEVKADNVPFPLTDVQYAYKIGREKGQELGDIGCHAYLEFSGKNVEGSRLEYAWNTLQRHHPMLRARFLEDGRQEIMERPYREHIDIFDFSNCADPEIYLTEKRRELSHRKLKVEEGQVAALTLCLLPEGKTRILFELDLLVADVQSMQIILRDLSSAYLGKELPGESREWSFAAYLEKQARDDAADCEQAKEYWGKRIHGMPFGPELPLKMEPSSLTETRFKRRIIRIQKEEWDNLQKKASENQVTPAVMLLAAYAMVLERWSSNKRFLINIPFFNRKTEYEGIEEVVADFTTLLLLEVNMEHKMTFGNAINAIQKQLHQDMKYTSYSGVQVQRDMVQAYGERRNIAPVVFACNLGTPLISAEFRNSLGDFSYMISQTPGIWLDFQTYEDENGVMLTWDAVDELFPEGMIADMLKSFEKILHMLGKEDWDQYFEILPEEQVAFIEKQKKIEPPDHLECLFEAFLQNVKKNSGKAAIIDTGENVQKSYGELEKEALSVAAYLVKHGIQKQPIAISLTRGYRQAVAALGILLSGNLYVPVSLNQPKERRQAIHEKTGIFYVITDENHFGSVTWPSAVQIWKLEDLCITEPLEKLPEICPEDSAYIIMTSGTTGLPKGAEMRHKGAWNTIADINNRANITSEDMVLGVSAMDFDLSVYDLFGMLSCGGTLVMIPEEKSRDAEFWLQQIVKYHITVWNSVPILLDMLLIQAEGHKVQLPLKTVMLSGDWIGMDLPERVKKLTKDCRFIAMGGATEASIWSNYLEVKLPLPKEWKTIPYGRPLSHQSYRVVDKKGMDVPFWAEGELWIGGVGVGAYRNDEELMQKKFVKDESGVWYRTGDKGRFWRDGTIEFLGREDFQVKIRGHRIELGEIETALKGIAYVKNAVVEPSDGKTGDRYLMAFLETGNMWDGPLFQKEVEFQGQFEQRWHALTEIKNVSWEENQFYAALKYGEWITCKVMLETLQRVGVFLDDNAYRLEDAISVGKISNAQRKTVKRWLAALVSNGFLCESYGKYKLKNHAGEKVDGFRLDSMESYFNRLKPHLPALLQGNVEPIDVYYAENEELAPSDLLEQMPGMKETVNAFISRITALVETDSKCIRILETGTRDLKITRMILNALREIKVEYTYSDPSLFFVNEAKSFSEEYPFVKFEVLDFEKNILNSEMDGYYDCILAVNALHRLDNKETVFSNVKKLLTPGGILLMMELTVQTCMQDIAATVLENEAKADMETAILNPAQWKAVLQENGFDHIFTYPENDSLYGRNIFIAMADCGKYSLNTEYIHSAIKEKLPDYMIPKVYYAVEKFPLNKNGKIDRKKLQTFETKQTQNQPKARPMTDTEKMLCAIWEDTFQIKGIGTQDNFYLLGGDSLIATRMLTKIKDKFQVQFTIRDLMGRKTIQEQAARVDELQKMDEKMQVQNLPQIVPDKLHENEPFPLTEVQQAYWIGRSGIYDLGQVSTHCYSELDCTAIDIKKLQETWNELIRYHGMMRAVILPDGRQQILQSVPEYQIPIEHLEECEPGIVEEKLLEIRREMSHQVITTEKWPLFDVRATMMPDEKWRIHISFDNLIFDGWSMFHLLSEWAKKYRGKYEETEELEISFRDYVLGLEKVKMSEAYERDKQYWLNRLDGFSGAPELPLAKKESDIYNQKFKRRSNKLNKDEWEKIKDVAKEFGITPAVLLITAYGEVLRRWSSNVDFTLNLTQFKREPLHTQVDFLVGDFTTLTLLEVKNSKGKNFLERARILQTQLMEDLEHSLYSAVEFERDLKQKSGNLKGSIMPVVFTSGLGIEEWSDGKWIGNLVYNVSQTPQVWLDHQVVEQDGNLNLFWDSVDDLFYPGMLDEMFTAYVCLLKKLAGETEYFKQVLVSTVNIPISEERIEANRTEKVFTEQTLDGMFLEMARKFPNNIAIVNQGKKITYHELKEKSLYICKQILREGTGREELVAIFMEKGWKQIVSVFGILFAGAAYLPLDIKNPEGRLKKILVDSNTRTILVTKDILEKNKWLKGWNCIIVDETGISSDEHIIVSKKADTLAYTIYTSGSTGNPKGVMITHEGAVNTILDINSKFSVDETDSILALSSLNFDLSVYDVFGLLGCGGKIVIPDYGKSKEPKYWVQLMNKESITLWNTVPTFMEMLMEYRTSEEMLEKQNLRLVLMSGDWIPKELPMKIYCYFDKVKVIGLGGATEASIWSNMFEIPKSIPDEWKSIPYGKPLSNQKYFVLDDMKQVRPDYVPGMLWIAGKGIAKGYLNDREETLEKFQYIPHLGMRLYCTGDIGRYWRDGNIEFLGRKDFQVKIMGYRIELGEIKNILNKAADVRQCEVFMSQKAKAIYVALTINKNCKNVERLINQLHRVAEEKLPEYMRPECIQVVDEIPLSENGKVDVKKIEEIMLLTSPRYKEILEPTTELECQIRDIWKEILRYEQVSLNDNFFKNGGDSLKAIKLINALKEKYDIEIPLNQLFESPCLFDLTKYIENSKNDEYEEGSL